MGPADAKERGASNIPQRGGRSLAEGHLGRADQSFVAAQAPFVHTKPNSSRGNVFHLSIFTYLLVWAYIAATWFVASRSWRIDPYRGLGRVVLLLLVATVIWAARGLVVHVPRGPNPDFTYESVGCFLAILSGLLGIVWCGKSLGAAPLMAIGGGG